ncbi:hypothetical protein ACFWVM_29345 [Nocardia fluminea]|uniref:hypothetical protein n=1 Tax=Nocardia fluminea TaxID=134984 RepID=UPI003649D074
MATIIPDYRRMTRGDRRSLIVMLLKARHEVDTDLVVATREYNAAKARLDELQQRRSDIEHSLSYID